MSELPNELNVLEGVTARLDSAHIPFMLTGSLALNFYAQSHRQQPAHRRREPHEQGKRSRRLRGACLRSLNASSVPVEIAVLRE